MSATLGYKLVVGVNVHVSVVALKNPFIAYKAVHHDILNSGNLVIKDNLDIVGEYSNQG